MNFMEHVVEALLTGVLGVLVSLDSAPPSAPPSDAEPSERPDRDVRVSEPPAGAYGRDISWPQCPRGRGIPERRTLGKPLPSADARYVVIGLTNGPAFYPNPCLRDQVAFARSRRLWVSAYAVVTYPTARQLQEYGDDGPGEVGSLPGRLWNTGWAQARTNVRHMRAAGLRSPMVWLDVETVRPPAPWSSDVRANRLVVEGAMAAYRTAGLRLGVYSTTYLWRGVVGDVSYGLPEWRAAGQTSRQAALRMCTRGSIQGGVAVMAQWATPDVDYNVLCPGRPPLAVLREFFSPR